MVMTVPKQQAYQARDAISLDDECSPNTEKGDHDMALTKYRVS
jgi:hypothetical protein